MEMAGKKFFFWKNYRMWFISFWRMNEIVKAIFVNCETDTIFNNDE